MSRKSYSGKFKPKNYKKYKGDPTKIIYRSLWERRFMVYCDNNPSIIEWGSEEIIIPYRSPIDKRVHRYFPDFYIKYVNAKGQVIREIIEVKPKKQLSPPKEPKRRTQRYLKEVATYVVNQAKFKAANEFCHDRKYGFRILTEDHLVK
jgi:hypothetical protein|tara:strand:- start:130 stop:573 length:444 start_codon:yes stop_codon:yes gene_type:complete